MTSLIECQISVPELKLKTGFVFVYNTFQRLAFTSVLALTEQLQFKVKSSTQFAHFSQRLHIFTLLSRKISSQVSFIFKM